MIMMQCSKESMNYWDKLEPTDENVSRLFQSEAEGGCLVKEKCRELNYNF